MLAARRFALAAQDGVALERWRARLGRYVLAVGGIEPRKGTLDLLEAYVLLRQSTPDIHLVIAGGETLFDYRDCRDRFDKCAADLGVEPVVLGQVRHDELPSLVAAASVFAFPSTKEGFGLARFADDPAGLAEQLRSPPVFPGAHIHCLEQCDVQPVVLACKSGIGAEKYFSRH